MVEDRVADGKRIAQLLSSELTGLENPPLDRVGVADADPDAEPTEEGTRAYAVTVDGERLGAVALYPSRAVLTVDAAGEIGAEGAADAAREDLTVERSGSGLAVSIESGAAVKAAVDLVAAIAAAS